MRGYECGRVDLPLHTEAAGWFLCFLAHREFGHKEWPQRFEVISILSIARHNCIRVLCW